MAEQKLLLSNPNEINVLTFGNSLTEGYADFGMTFHPYSIALEKKLSTLLPTHKINITVNGLSGDRVLTSLNGIFLKRLQSSLPLRKTGTPKYDLVIVLGGTNDLAYLIGDADGPNKIFEGLKECYAHVLEARASLLCLTVPERAIDTRASKLAEKARNARLELNKLIAGFVNEHETLGEEGAEEAVSPSKVFLFDLAKAVPFPNDRDEDGDWDTTIWSPDGLHMMPQGYDFVGEELATHIFDLLQGATLKN